ncbi:MAG: hypothetical protein DDT23_00035 [candidate division WS2 bacterium]|nr:hypothetical protein [Candidatus Lithacetigena glycinireducens]
MRLENRTDYKAESWIEKVIRKDELASVLMKGIKLVVVKYFTRKSKIVIRLRRGREDLGLVEWDFVKTLGHELHHHQEWLIRVEKIRNNKKFNYRFSHKASEDYAEVLWRKYQSLEKEV